jgi:hypothetical protein
MEYKPKQSDIQAAKEYILKRLDAERSMVYNLEKAMQSAAEQICKICYSYGYNPQTFSFSFNRKMMAEIDAVIETLYNLILEDFEELALAANEDDADYILALILGAEYGETYQDRLTDYLAKFKHELEVLIGAGLFLGLSLSVVAKSISNNLRKPYNNPVLADGIAEEVTYGRGKTKSMFTAISTLSRYGIAKAWMREWEKGWSNKDGIIGYIVERGSSYPCDLCDENTGFHPVDEGTGLPVHPNCCCFAVPVFLEL